MAAGRRVALLAPLTGFLLVFFVAPLAWLLSLAVREAEVPRALPRTLARSRRGSRTSRCPPASFLPSAATSSRAARRARSPTRRGASTTR
jgi:hypothetical protein